MNEFLTPEQFAILPWGWTPASKPNLDGIKACGFNLAGFVGPGDLDLVESAGLKAILSDESTHVTDQVSTLPEDEINQRVRKLVSRVKGHPALYGYYLRDEPSASIFSGLARWTQAFRQEDPDGAPYLNLFPNYATAAQLGLETYSEYVEQFMDQVKPPFLSYDNYSLMEDGRLRAGYFENLAIARQASIQRGIPFWNIVLANAHFTYAEPSPAGLRFQMYTTLAYGARGISYFTYFTPDVGNYRLAAVDPFGEKTPTWNMLREVNLQIHQLGPTYLALKSQGVFHTDGQPGSAGIESSRFLREVIGGKFVVGEFDSPEDLPHLIVVNKDLHRSVSLTLRFKRPGELYRTSPYSGKTEPVGSEDNWLAPGQGVLLSHRE